MAPSVAGLFSCTIEKKSPPPKLGFARALPCVRLNRGLDCDAQYVPSMAGLHGCAITGENSATMMIVTTAVRDTLIPPTANAPRAAQTLSQSNKRSVKPPTAEGRVCRCKFRSRARGDSSDLHEGLRQYRPQLQRIRHCRPAIRAEILSCQPNPPMM